VEVGHLPRGHGRYVLPQPTTDLSTSPNAALLTVTKHKREAKQALPETDFLKTMFHGLVKTSYPRHGVRYATPAAVQLISI
jgi:hypothetical protein